VRIQRLNTNPLTESSVAASHAEGLVSSLNKSITPYQLRRQFTLIFNKTQKKNMKLIFLISIVVTILIFFSGCYQGAEYTNNSQPQQNKLNTSEKSLTNKQLNSQTSKEVDLSKISNLADFQLGPKAKKLLSQNGFVVIPTNFESIYQIYEDCRKRNIPIFVTTDVVLHTSHILFDYVLRIIEIEKLMEDLRVLTDGMLEASINQYNVATTQEVEEAARNNVAFFSVAAKLLDEKRKTLSFVKDIVEKELDYIRKQEGFQYSPIFGYKEDYSQYVPRGHYTRNAEFEIYFKTMLWYGRMKFGLKPGKTGKAIKAGKEQTIQASLITDALNRATIGNQKALTVWERIYNTTTFFVGVSDDLNVYDYNVLIEQIYGDMTSINKFSDEEKLKTFISKATGLRKPKILSSFSWDFENWTEDSQAFRFMGQRFIPDSYMFQQLVYDKVGTRDNPRLLPKGLDIMAVLGSKKADEILKEEGDFKYLNYGEQLEKLKEEFAPYDEKIWTQNLYWTWLYSLKTLFEEKEGSYPFFMQNDAWSCKELNTALGSWVELRHNTILYGKQSYTVMVTGVRQPKPIELTYGYVEPYPAVYSIIAVLADKMLKQLGSQNLLTDECRIKLSSFTDLLTKLEIISEKELTGQTLTESKYQTIWNTGKILNELIRFSPRIREKISAGVDEKMAVIADVHTDPNKGRVLEAGIGNPFSIYVINEVKGEKILLKGGVFSYYEFQHPMQERLTDEKWQEIGSKGVDRIPEWTKKFVIK